MRVTYSYFPLRCPCCGWTVRDGDGLVAHLLHRHMPQEQADPSEISNELFWIIFPNMIRAILYPHDQGNLPSSHQRIWIFCPFCEYFGPHFLNHMRHIHLHLVQNFNPTSMEDHPHKLEEVAYCITEWKMQLNAVVKQM